jgi:hypothetical protein
VIDGIAAGVGVAWASASTAGDLLIEADAAMCVAKQNHLVVPVPSTARDTQLA